MIKYCVALFLCMCACGISPEDAADDLQWQVVNPSGWCGYEDGVEVEIEKIIPDGYGITGTGTECLNSDSSWPGGYCKVPSSTVHRVRLFNETGDAAWFKNMTDEYGAAESRMNARGWDLDRVSSGAYNIEGHTGTTHPQGWLGFANPNTYTVTFTPKGQLRRFARCDYNLYKTAIEANGAYQAASDTQRGRYLKNLWDHELNHCLGLGHLTTSDELMSVNYSFPGPYFGTNLNPNAAELADFEDFVE